MLDLDKWSSTKKWTLGILIGVPLFFMVLGFWLSILGGGWSR